MMVGILVSLALWAVEAVFWVLSFLWRSIWFLADMVRANRAMKGGTLHCQNDHPVPTEGGLYECECGYVYEGSIFKCPFCSSSTPWVKCPTCGISVKSPYIFGKR